MFSCLLSDITLTGIIILHYSTDNNKWDFYVVCASLNLSARVAKSSIYYCEYYIVYVYVDLKAIRLNDF